MRLKASQKTSLFFTKTNKNFKCNHFCATKLKNLRPLPGRRRFSSLKTYKYVKLYFPSARFDTLVPSFTFLHQVVSPF